MADPKPLDERLSDATCVVDGIVTNRQILEFYPQKPPSRYQCVDRGDCPYKERYRGENYCVIGGTFSRYDGR